MHGVNHANAIHLFGHSPQFDFYDDNNNQFSSYYLSNLVAALKNEIQTDTFFHSDKLCVQQLQLQLLENAKCSSILACSTIPISRHLSVHPQSSINMCTSSFPSSISIPSPHIAIVIAARPLCMWDSRRTDRAVPLHSTSNSSVRPRKLT